MQPGLHRDAVRKILGSTESIEFEHRGSAHEKHIYVSGNYAILLGYSQDGVLKWVEGSELTISGHTASEGDPIEQTFAKLGEPDRTVVNVNGADAVAHLYRGSESCLWILCEETGAITRFLLTEGPIEMVERDSLTLDNIALGQSIKDTIAQKGSPVQELSPYGGSESHVYSDNSSVVYSNETSHTLSGSSLRGPKFNITSTDTFESVLQKLGPPTAARQNALHYDRRFHRISFLDFGGMPMQIILTDTFPLNP